MLNLKVIYIMKILIFINFIIALLHYLYCMISSGHQRSGELIRYYKSVFNVWLSII